MLVAWQRASGLGKGAEVREEDGQVGGGLAADLHGG